jgi:hypothetical protein
MVPAITEWYVGRRSSPGHSSLRKRLADKRQPYIRIVTAWSPSAGHNTPYRFFGV